MSERLKRARERLFLDPLEYMQVAGEEWEREHKWRNASLLKRLRYWLTWAK